MASDPDQVELLPAADAAEQVPRSLRRRVTQRLSSPVVVIGAGGVLVVAILAVGYASASTGSSDRYRLASATTSSVVQGLALTGTLSPIHRSDVSFPISGEVVGIDVQPGDHVSAGDELAILDTTSLKAAVTSAKSTLAQAELSLEQAENGQSSGGLSSGSGSSGKASTQSVSGKPSSGSGSAGSGSNSKLRQQQQQVIHAQQQVSEALSASQLDLKNASSVCAAADSTALDVDPSASPGSSPSEDANACITAQQKVLASQQNVSQLQAQLSQAQTQLNQTLQQMITQASKQNGSSSKPSSGGSNSGGSNTVTVTAEDLAAAQAKVDAADAAVRAAQQDLQAATIVSPIDGKIGAIGFAVGDSVSADSTTEVVTVTGGDQYQVAVQVPVEQITQVHRGNSATVRPDGAAGDLKASVVSIGIGATTTNSKVTYPVTLSITGKSDDLRVGATATVSLTTGQADNTLVVPTSAVRRVGTSTVVTVLDDSGDTTTTPVTIGAVGGIYTQIKSGLTEGQQVVLADLQAELPQSNTQNFPRTGGLGGGGFGGAGFGGGGARTFPAGSR